jgi:FtsP/CotA-like multicopper oxidase with cupredoxin domain
MRTTDLTVSALLRTLLVAIGALGLMVSTAAAQTHTVRLVAAPLNKAVTLPNGSTIQVPMWGFALEAEDTNLNGILDAGEDANGNGILDPQQAPTVPGPRIAVPTGTATLEVFLRNALSGAGAEPVSLVIPGQPFEAAPVPNASGRIFSMTAETAPGMTGRYVFSGIKPGTFLYQSGTHQAVQIQMGLYGAMTMDDAASVPGAALAYAGVSYAHEVVLLYSEIDVALHESVANGTYGQPDSGGPTSTFNYRPSLFLVNGESYANDVKTPEIAAGAAGARTLIRMLNAGLRTHAPTLDNATLSLVAEDGNAYPFERAQAAVMLSAGKTQDAIWQPAAGLYVMYDRMLNLTADVAGDAGMLAKLRVSGGAPSDGPVTAIADAYSTSEDVDIIIPGTTRSAGVLGNDAGAGAATATAILVTSPGSGTLARFSPNGTFRYNPGQNFAGVDSFTYQARAADGTLSAPATVTISVAGVSDAPRAIAQAAGVDARQSIPIALNASDPDGDELTFYLTTNPANPAVGLPPVRRGSLSIIDPVTKIERTLTAADLKTATQAGTPIPAGNLIFNAYAGPLVPLYGDTRFWFLVSDGTLSSNVAAVTVTVFAPELTQNTGNPLTLTVMGVDGTPITAYRWTLEEDRTYEVIPGTADPNTSSVSFHASYMPLKQSGDESVQPLVDPLKRYFVSVLPKSGPYTNGGAEIARGQSAVTVRVNSGPQPTAQIRVRVFEDNAGTNGVWDAAEAGLAGFEVGIDDAGGRYGMSGGQQIMDAWGNQIGTTYQACTDPAGCESYEVASIGKGYIVTDGDGYALIKNLSPGKFTVKVRPPGGDTWVQTSTIEGTKGVDAWVKANEPQYFTEFGPPGPHVEIGFVRATSGAGVLGPGPGARSTIIGRVTNMRMSRPPNASLYSGAPFDFTKPWVALNAGATGTALLYAQPVNDDGTFSIQGVPLGSYQLVVFDSALDIIIASQVVNVSSTAVTDLKDVPVFHWFTRLYNYVFEDTNENGFWDKDLGEIGLPEQAINIRWRDGSVYQSSATDGAGFVPFEEVFPFFAWQVAEVDYTRFKATGVTVVVDNGGDSSVNTAWPGLVGAELDPLVLAPQPQMENNGQPFRTETGPVLLQAFQGFIGQSNLLLWGKKPYAPAGSIVEDVNVAPFDDFPGPGDTDDGCTISATNLCSDRNGTFDVDRFHGGISGIVHYTITRAENDPRWGTGEPWEPGVPGARVQLWDVTRTKLLNEVTSDSWDDSLPTGCQTDVNGNGADDPGEKFIYLGRTPDCYDGLRNFNQVRPAVFDGGYAFYTQKEPFNVAMDARTIERALPAGKYVVKVIVPDGYGLVKEEDKNVDFGEEYIPAEFYLSGYPLGDAGVSDAPPGVTTEEYPLYAPFCVGSLHEVPEQLALFPGVMTAYGGDKRPLCDAKLVNLRAGQNAAANFFLFTEAPIAGHIVGFVLDDTTNEFDPNAPTFGEKYAPPFMPVAIKDWTGREITRTYTDAYGVYNVLVPSTWTANAPIPSGMAPNMLTACINAPTLPGPNGTQIPDPHFLKQYSHFCYTMQFMPGTTSYLDTPVVPTGAFTGNGTFPVDAELPNRTPIIHSVNGTLGIGPYIVDRGALDPASRTITITAGGDADGNVLVANPAYSGAGDTVNPKVIARDYSFGDRGFVTLGGRRLPVTLWSPKQIVAEVPANTTADPLWRTGQLAIERCLTPITGGSGDCADKRKSILGVTLTVASVNMHTRKAPKVVAAGQKIQAAIDAAAPGDLILVQPGIYEEMVVMTKPVRLQGWGALSTAITVVSTPAENLQAWRDFVGNLLANNPGYLLPDQANIIGPPPFAEGAIAAGIGGEGAGVQVFGRDSSEYNEANGRCGWSPFLPPANAPFCLQNENQGAAPAVFRSNARIDGFAISGASNAAGIQVNAYARMLEISNNKIFNNYGDFAGGIRLGHAGGPLPLADEDAQNYGASIHNNMVTQNAGMNLGGGGGIVLGTGSACLGETAAQGFCGYDVVENFVAANFTMGQGAGIAHLGLSHGGSIERNTIVFNESFNQGLTVNGAGLFIGGRPGTALQMTPGSGTVRVLSNLIQGNQAASGDGGGVALLGVNGQDANSVRYRVNLFNNVIANNTAALAGGGIAIQDAAFVDIVHNTIVHNDSLATAGAAFADPLLSTAQPSGIVSRGHTPLLRQELGRAFAVPDIVNSIVWENRSFHFGPTAGGGIVLPTDPTATQYGLILDPANQYWDLGFLGTPATANFVPVSSVLTSTAGYEGLGNTSSPPAFVAEYLNTDRRTAYAMPDIYNPMQAPAAFDEGGNFIRPQFGPLSLEAQVRPFWGNYHVSQGSVGANLNVLYAPAAVPAALLTDIDRQARPAIAPHRGADQKLQGVAAPVTPIP